MCGEEIGIWPTPVCERESGRERERLSDFLTSAPSVKFTLPEAASTSTRLFPNSLNSLCTCARLRGLAGPSFMCASLGCLSRLVFHIFQSRGWVILFEASWQRRVYYVPVPDVRRLLPIVPNCLCSGRHKSPRWWREVGRHVEVFAGVRTLDALKHAAGSASWFLKDFFKPVTLKQWPLLIAAVLKRIIDDLLEN